MTDETPQFEVLDGGQASDEPAPKRGRGRPPGSKNKPKDDTAPVAAGGPSVPKRRAYSRRGAKHDLTGDLIQFLSLLNFAFMLPMLPASVQGDYLRPTEIDQLARAINAQAQASPLVYKWITAAMGPGGGASVNLVVVVGVILARRAAFHGVAPEALLAIAGNPDKPGVPMGTPMDFSGLADAMNPVMAEEA